MIPLNERYPLKETLATLDKHILRTNRQVSIAYLPLKGVNDRLEHADALVELFRGREELAYLYHFNVIRYHPAQGTLDEFATPDAKCVRAFAGRLRRAGLNVTQRPSFGKEIDAACGQLTARYLTTR